TWKDLTENVNELAANLTTQVRAIAEVATAVTQGDLTRSITVDTQGEVAALRDTINEMIRNLRDTTQKNTEQDWLKTNLAKFSRMLQGQRDLVAVGQMILSELAPVVGAQQAEFYVLSGEEGENQKLKLLASFASGGQATHGKEVDVGQGLVGQCAIEKRKLTISGVPAASFRVATGLAGEGAAARAPERGSGEEEPRGGAGAPGAGREGGAARADIEVQVGVPRQHVARAAHAAQ